MNTKLLKGLTEWMFVMTMVTSVLCIFASYAIAFYAMVVYEQVYTLAELAAPALNALWLTLGAKVIENIFKNNDGVVFGTSNKDKKEG